MTIPFLDIFKKVTARFGRAGQPAVEPVVRTPLPKVEKPTSERLHKTVLPNATRASAPGSSVPLSSNAPAKPGLPPAVAFALQPRVERAISLKLSDFVAEIPPGYIKSPETFDTSRRVLLKASEIERGMATGKPTVSLTSLYEQVPEIFLHSLSETETGLVPLPYAKVMDQFSNVRTRNDQEVEQTVPQFDTPFLQVTIEDTKKFGTTMEPVLTSANPPVKVQPATAETLSTAEPEPVVKETAPPPAAPRKTISLTAPVAAPPPAPPLSQKPSATLPPSEAPARIPFQFPPKGVGASDSERVPASSGPPTPAGAKKPEPAAPASTPPPTPTPAPPSAATPTPTPAAPAPATRIPFKLPTPSDALRPKLTLIPGAESAEPEKKAEPKVETPAPSAAMEKPVPAPAPKVPAPTAPMPAAPAPTTAPLGASTIRVSLRAVMQNVPAFQLTGSAESIPADVQIEFPLHLVESQLASGRVAMPPKAFQTAMPEAHRGLFAIDTAETPVLLPLQEVLKNLPSASLRMREDQEEIDAAGSFETPFSLKAKEDAKRFGESAPVAKPPQAAAAVPEKSEPPAEKPAMAEDGQAQLPIKVEAKIPTPEQTAKRAEEAAKRAEEAAQAQAASKKDHPELALKLAGPTQPAAETKPEPEPAKPQPVEAKKEDVVAPKPGDDEPKPLETVDIKGRKEKNEAKDILARANALPGIAGCALTFADGLGLAGNLPGEFRADGLCAMAPSMLRKIERYMQDTKLGPLLAMTLHCEKAPVSFFLQGNICLSALQTGTELAAETRQELVEMTKTLSRTYTQPELGHVDH